MDNRRVQNPVSHATIWPNESASKGQSERDSAMTDGPKGGKGETAIHESSEQVGASEVAIAARRRKSFNNAPRYIRPQQLEGNPTKRAKCLLE